MGSASLWGRELEVFADIEREDFVDLGVRRHRRCFAGRTVDVQGMTPAFTGQLAPVLRKVAKQVDSSSFGEDQGLADDILALK